MKGIRVDGGKVFNGLFTVMNEHNQVVAQVSVSVHGRKACNRPSACLIVLLDAVHVFLSE